MTNSANTAEKIREKIIADPEFILEDPGMMRALVAADPSALGGNIVDLRGIALDRLETRLDRLEDTHRSVIAAAYENLAGTNVIHRAILQLLEPTDFVGFMENLTEIADIMRVDMVRLVLETVQEGPNTALAPLKDIMVSAPKGTVDQYILRGRNTPTRSVTLRQIQPKNGDIYGENADWIRSEACLKLDFGPGTLPGMLVFGSEDPHQFKPTQGTDLMQFFAGVFERAMRRWLA
ncbi:MAG: DUF484 family protein [Paracoccaceae bacterium]